MAVEAQSSSEEPERPREAGRGAADGQMSL